MKITKLTINGPNVKPLINFIKKEEIIMKNDYFFTSHLDNCIFILQKHSIRATADLLSVIIINFIGKNKCKIEIVSGGEGHGWLGLTFGSEENRNKQLVKIIAKICRIKLWKLTIKD